jgi:hypothetical protein
MPKTKTPRTSGSVPSDKFKIKKRIEYNMAIAELYSKHRPTVAEMKKAFKENDMNILNYPTLEEFRNKPNPKKFIENFLKKKANKNNK